MGTSRTSSKARTVGSVLAELEIRAPQGTAEDWDNVGLLVGDPASLVSQAIVSIDLSEAVLKRAKATGAELIINHHPCIFPKNRGLAQVTAPGLAYQAARQGVAVISCHTNFDQCALEVVQAVSRGLGVQSIGRLIEKKARPLVKLVVFVPGSHLDAVKDAVCQAGAGHIGNYDSCAFSAAGEGQFRGGVGTTPFLGKAQKLEKVQEFRLETVLPEGLVSQVLLALRKSHPYQEIAYDLYRLEQKPDSLGGVRGLGYGLIGQFNSLRPFSELARDVKRVFGINGFLMTEPAPRRIKKIGFVAGKGTSFMSAALAAGCDLFITGEAGYHAAMECSRGGMAVMELGHRESEVFFPSTMSGWLKSMGLKSTIVDEPMQKLFIGGSK